MGDFEHPKFKVLQQIFETFRRSGQLICIDRHERLWVMITEIERTDGSYGNTYDGLLISGSATKKSKCCNVPNKVPRSREP